MSISVLGYVAVVFGAIVAYLQIRNTLLIRRAEQRMAMAMLIKLSSATLEELRDDLLKLKVLAIKAGHKEMERFYDIEHQMNLITENLNRVERQLIAQGLQQPSNKGRLEYMIKLVDLSLIATPQIA